MTIENSLFLDRPAFQSRRLKIVCIGAGFSGLTLAYKIQHDAVLKDVIDLVIYEKNPDVGGTWFENTYPGVACDIPAHAYSFPFAPNPDWSKYYVSGQEIQDYIKAVTKKYNLDQHVQLNTRVLQAAWNNEAGSWSVDLRGPGDTSLIDTADVLIHASGFLNKWRWPDIPQLHTFAGKLVHSASWDRSLQWEGKNVALIGNGSSGIQILPKIAETAKHVTTYIRNPTWISTPLAADPARGYQNFSYSEEEKAQFLQDPKKLRDHRRKIEHTMNTNFPGVIRGSDMSQAAQQVFTQLMRHRLNNDEDLTRRLIPDFPALCRRLTPGEGYLEALQKSNVRIEFNEIERVQPEGIVANETGLEKFDMIFCATGFDTTFVPNWKMVGRNGVELADQWKTDPAAYFGVCIPNMPNMFVFNGPNSPISQGSLTTAIDFVSDYILRWCRKIAAQEIKSICVTADATSEYNVYANEFLSRTVWAGSCRSWYKNGSRDGRITAIYGGSMLHFRECLEAFRTEDFDMEYRHGNRFRFMGNGRSAEEFKGGDLGFYVK